MAKVVKIAKMGVGVPKAVFWDCCRNASLGTRTYGWPGRRGLT
jgi:hypothetical protein